MSHEGANVMALVDSCKNVVYHSQNVKELRGLNVISNPGAKYRRDPNPRKIGG
jgi:hypothetical protein